MTRPRRGCCRRRTVVVVVGVVVVVTRRLRPALCRWAQAAEWLLRTWREQSDGRGRDAGDKSTPPPAAHGSRLASSNWHLDLQPHGCTCRRARLRRWSRQVGTTRSRSHPRDGSQRSNGHVGGEALADSSEQRTPSRSNCRKASRISQSPRRRRLDLRAVSAPLVREIECRSLRTGCKRLECTSSEKEKVRRRG